MTSEEHFGFLVADVAKLMRRHFEQKLDATPLTPSQARALVYVARNEGCRQVELAELLEIKPITLARVIDQLELAQVVERRADPTDRRAHCLYLSSSAPAALENIQSVALAIREAALRNVTSQEAEVLTAILLKLRNNLAS